MVLKMRKEVQNFIFDVEQYFEAVRELEKAKKVSITARYCKGMPRYGGE